MGIVVAALARAVGDSGADVLTKRFRTPVALRHGLVGCWRSPFLAIAVSAQSADANLSFLVHLALMCPLGPSPRSCTCRPCDLPSLLVYPFRLLLIFLFLEVVLGKAEPMKVLVP
jgi:hypothetical protein